MPQTQHSGEPCLPTVSVVMPVFNEEKTISEALMSVLEQDYPPDLMEILVVDGRSTDRTCEIVSEIAKDFPQVHLLSNKRRTVSSGRNVGIRASTGDWIFIVDGHSFVAANYVSVAIGLAQRVGALCLARPQPLFIDNDGYIARAIAVARESRFGGSVNTHRNADLEGWVEPTSVAVVYHRSLFQRFGLFDERFETNEDVEFNWRLHCAGIQAYFSPDMHCRYYPRRSLLGLRRQMFRYGFYRMLFLKKHKAAFHWSYAVPVLFLLSQIAIFLLRRVIPDIARPVLVAELSMYGFGLLLSSIHTAKNRGWYYLPVLPFVYIVIHCGVGGGFIWGGITPLGRTLNVDVNSWDDGVVETVSTATFIQEPPVE